MGRSVIAMNEDGSSTERWRTEAENFIPRKLNLREVEFIKKLSPNPNFQKRVTAKMILDTRELVVTFADKVKSLEFVREFVPHRYLPEQYFVAQFADELKDFPIPREFVIKTSHGSGGLIVVSEEADPNSVIPEPGVKSDWARIAISPENFDLEKAIPLLNRWLAIQYRQEENTIREWCYSEIPPRLRAEKYYKSKYLIPEQMNIFFLGGEPFSYNFREPLIDNHKTFDYRFMAGEENSARICTRLSRHIWEEIIESSRKMSQFTDMVRIDWMITNEGPIFSELTNYPAAGNIVFAGTSSRSAQEERAEYDRLWNELIL